MKIKKLSSFILALAMCIGFSGGNAYAAEKTQDGVKLVITSDKTVYNKDDKIITRLSLENNSESDITDVSLEGMIPENYHLSEDSKAVLRATYIMSGDSVSSELVFVPDKKESDMSSEKENTIASEDIVSDDTAVVSSTSDEKNAVSPNPDVDDRSGGPGLGGKLVVAAVILLAAGAAVIIFRKKGGKKGMMILFCITAAGTFSTMQKVEALESETRIISVSETVTVAGKQCDLTANVRFTMDIPDMQAAVEEYYEDNSEEIISVEDVKETEDVFTEKEAITFLSERGFNEYPLTYDFNMDGTYVDEAEASLESNEKHPMYQTFYVSEDGSIWTVFIVGKTIAANPASYNLESDIDAQILVSEAETLTSYTEMGNKLYKTIPKESAVILKVVDKITSEKLNSLTYEEVVKQ